MGCFECYSCALAGGCLAGHDDDDYTPATKEQVIERLDNNEYSRYRDRMINYLKYNFNYDYENSKSDKGSGYAIIKEFESNSLDNKLRTKTFDCLVVSSDVANKITNCIKSNNGKIKDINVIPLAFGPIRVTIAYQGLESDVNKIQEMLNDKTMPYWRE